MNATPAPGYDIARDVSFELEELDDLVGELLVDHAERAPRDARIVALRLGIGGQRPQTLSRIGAGYDLARDRVRQLYTKAVGRVVIEAAASRLPIRTVFAGRYPIDLGDNRLVAALLAETYATDTDLVATEWSYLKLRLAGHSPTDAKRVAGYVMQRILGWQKKTASILGKLHPADDPGDFTALLDGIEWSPGPVAALPHSSARVLDGDDDGRGRFYLAKVGRQVCYDSAMTARLLRMLDGAANVVAFQEEPTALTYDFGGIEQVHYPSVVAGFADGRVALIDVLPLGRIAFHHTRVQRSLGRAFAAERGWGYLAWTGSSLDEHRLVGRPDVARLATTLGQTRWSRGDLARECAETGLLDLAGLVLRDEATRRLDRLPIRLSTVNA
ncbi:hypothetical protein [Nocardia camponoti]|nr:hypothetical protein [Nocardia camponoti]